MALLIFARAAAAVTAAALAALSGIGTAHTRLAALLFFVDVVASQGHNNGNYRNDDQVFHSLTWTERTLPSAPCWSC